MHISYNYQLVFLLYLLSSLLITLYFLAVCHRQCVCQTLSWSPYFLQHSLPGVRWLIPAQPVSVTVESRPGLQRWAAMRQLWPDCRGVNMWLSDRSYRWYFFISVISWIVILGVYINSKSLYSISEQIFWWKLLKCNILYQSPSHPDTQTNTILILTWPKWLQQAPCPKPT